MKGKISVSGYGMMVLALALIGCGGRSLPAWARGEEVVEPHGQGDGGAKEGGTRAGEDSTARDKGAVQGFSGAAWSCSQCQGTPRCVCTVAGTGVAGMADGPVYSARFNNPLDVAVDTQGKVYVVDSMNNRIRLIAAGQVSTLAGTGKSGYADGPASSAMFNKPMGVAAGADGRIYVADYGNGSVRIIASEKVTTLPWEFNKPHRVAVASDGKLYVTSIEGLHVIDKAGKSTNKMKFTHGGVAVEGNGKVYVGVNNQVMHLSQGTLVPYAGTGKEGQQDGPLASATFFGVHGLAADRWGRLYVANTYCVREISGGQVNTLGLVGKGFKDGPVKSAEFYGVFGVAVDGAGNLYISDRDNNRVRMITAP